MCIESASSRTQFRVRRQNGVSLVELVMFIVIVSVAVLGILAVMNITTGKSADPLIRKQALAIAESLMEEIILQPFTFCDVSDPNAATARFAAAAPPGTPSDQLPYYCSAADTVQGLGASGKSRTTEPRFDNVGNYHNFSMIGIQNMQGTPIGGLAGYSAQVAIVQDARGGIPAADSLRIDVTVTGPGNETVTVTGYRFRYAPRAVP